MPLLVQVLSSIRAPPGCRAWVQWGCSMTDLWIVVENDSASQEKFNMRDAAASVWRTTLFACRMCDAPIMNLRQGVSRSRCTEYNHGKVWLRDTRVVLVNLWSPFTAPFLCITKHGWIRSMSNFHDYSELCVQKFSIVNLLRARHCQRPYLPRSAHAVRHINRKRWLKLLRIVAGDAISPDLSCHVDTNRPLEQVSRTEEMPCYRCIDTKHES